jgi:hypothetical protein
MRRGLIVLLAVAALAVTATAQSSAVHAAPAKTTPRWTEPFAEISLVSKWTTVDPIYLAYVKGIMGLTNPKAAINAAMHTARPITANCSGVGYHKGRYYARFWCTTHVSSDQSNYEATLKITLYVKGKTLFAVKNGWR